MVPKIWKIATDQDSDFFSYHCYYSMSLTHYQLMDTTTTRLHKCIIQYYVKWLQQPSFINSMMFYDCGWLMFTNGAVTSYWHVYDYITFNGEVPYHNKLRELEYDWEFTAHVLLEVFSFSLCHLTSREIKHLLTVYIKVQYYNYNYS